MIFRGASFDLMPDTLFTLSTKLIEYTNKNEINFMFWLPTVLVKIFKLKILESIKNLVGLTKGGLLAFVIIFIAFIST